MSILRALSLAQATSGLVFTTFLGVHLISPAILAANGSESAASKWMLLGRVYYQGTLTEPLLIYGSIGVHLASSLLRRLLYPATVPKRSSLLTLSPSPWVLHSITGFILAPFLLHHVVANRIYPSSSTPLISNLSPSELDYSFVAWSLKRYPLIESIAYAGLIAAGLWHALSGIAVIWKKYGPTKKKGEAKRRLEHRDIWWSWAAACAVLGTGVVRLVMNDTGVGRSLGMRFEAVYQMGIGKYVYQ